MVRGLTAMVNSGEAKQHAMRNSKELRFRLENADRDIKHVMGQVSGLKGKKAALQRMMLVGIPFVQLHTVDIPTWIAAYQMASKTMNDPEAFAFADSRVRMSQGSGSAKDQAAFMAQRGSSRAYSMFMTFFNTMYSIQGKLAREAAWTPEFANKLVTGGIIMYVLPSIIEATFRMQWPEDEEDWPAFLAMKTAYFAMSSIPLVRDVVAATEKGRRFSGSPISGLGETTAKTIQTVAELVIDWDDTEVTEADVKGAVNMIGFATGVIPSTYINRIIGAANKYVEEGEINIWEFFIGPTRDK